MNTKGEGQKFQITTIWADGFKSTVVGTATEVGKKTVEAFRRCGVDVERGLTDQLIRDCGNVLVVGEKLVRSTGGVRTITAIAGTDL